MQLLLHAGQQTMHTFWSNTSCSSYTCFITSNSDARGEDVLLINCTMIRCAALLLLHAFSSAHMQRVLPQECCLGQQPHV
jgi:hypothetical protein